MRVTKFTMNPKNRVFQFVMTGNQEEFWKFLEKLNLPLGTSMNYKAVKEKEVKLSLHSFSNQEFEQLYKHIDSILLEYIV